MKKLLPILCGLLLFALPCLAADEEMTDFTALGAAPASGDLLGIVDVSDTTDSAEGTTKKVQFQYVFTVPDGVTFTFDESAADPNDADVVFSASDGVLTIAATNGVNNESLTFNFDAAANKVTIGTGSGVTTLDTGSIALESGNHTINTTTPIIMFDDTTGGATADGAIQVNANDNDDAIMSILIDDSGGDDQTYVEFDGVTETIDLLQNITILDSATLIFDESAADPNDCDVALSATDGVITIGGVNGANNESITINVDAVADVVTVTSPTGATIVFTPEDVRQTSVQNESHGEARDELTEAEVLAAKFVTNQGSAGETDTGLPALSYYISLTFIVNEAFIFELTPPSGELFDLDGVLLDANDCVDSPTGIGAKLVATRMLLADGSTWRWSLDTVRGTWVDGDAGD